MTNEPTAKPPVPAPKTPDAITQLKDLLPRLNDEQRRIASDDLGITIPIAYDGQDIKVVIYGYRCRQCNGVALKFRGDKPPAKGVPFDQLLWFQDAGKALDVQWKRRQLKAKPHCQHCGQQLALDPFSGGVKEDRLVTIQAYERAREAEIARRSRPRRNYERDVTRVAE